MAPRTPICAQTNGTATIRAHPEGSRMAAVTPNHAPRKRGPKPKNPGVTSRERKTLWEAANRSLKAALKRPRRKGCNRRIMSTREAIIPLNENRAKRNKAPLDHRLMNRVSKKKRARPPIKRMKNEEITHEEFERMEHHYRFNGISSQ